MKKDQVISEFQSRIGRLGGLKSSPAKRAAARAAARKRWGHQAASEIAVEDLEDGAWYSGKGRNADIALWDERGACFWVVALNDAVDPASFPIPGPRTVRLKREKPRCAGGTFCPLKLVR